MTGNCVLHVKSVFSFRQEVSACLKELAKLYPDEVMEAAVLSKLQLHEGNNFHNEVCKWLELSIWGCLGEWGIWSGGALSVLTDFDCFTQSLWINSAVGFWYIQVFVQSFHFSCILCFCFFNCCTDYVFPSFSLFLLHYDLSFCILWSVW